jgi:3-hydroxybutyryl-CoA dehydratase
MNKIWSLSRLRGLPKVRNASTTKRIVGTLIPSVGCKVTLTHTYNQSEVCNFATLCGDNNPIHQDPVYASKTRYGKPIVHGIFVSSLFSAIFGSAIEGSIYVNQSLKFLRPVFVDSTVVAEIEVIKIEKKKKGNLMTCRTEVWLLDDKERLVAVSGEAQVLVPV